MRIHGSRAPLRKERVNSRGGRGDLQEFAGGRFFGPFRPGALAGFLEIAAAGSKREGSCAGERAAELNFAEAADLAGVENGTDVISFGGESAGHDRQAA